MVISNPIMGDPKEGGWEEEHNEAGERERGEKENEEVVGQDGQRLRPFSFQQSRGTEGGGERKSGVGIAL